MNSTNARCSNCKRADGTVPYYNSAMICKGCAGILAELTSFDPSKLRQTNVHHDSSPKGGNNRSV